MAVGAIQLGGAPEARRRFRGTVNMPNGPTSIGCLYEPGPLRACESSPRGVVKFERRSRGVTIVAVEHAAAVFVTTDRSLRKSDFRSRFDVLTFATLPIPLSVIGDEVFVQRETRFSDLPGEIPADYKAVARKKLG